MKISCCIIALNEADRIGDAVRSALAACDEVLVVDGGSSDATMQEAERAGARVSLRLFDDFTPQKNYANAKCVCEWILSMDADERVSPELAAEIRALKEQEPPADVAAFAFPRHTFYLGRLIRHNWYPDIKPRLFRRDRAEWRGEFVHETLLINGRIERQRGPLLHYTYRDISDHVRRIEFYSTRAALKMRKEGRRSNFALYALLPGWTFIQFYFLRLGFLDAWPGFVVAALSAWSVMLKYLKLRELERRGA